MSQPVNAASTDPVSSIAAFADTLPHANLLTILGLVTLVVLPFILAYAGFRLFNYLSALIHRKAALTAMKNDTTQGNKILVATIAGLNGYTVRKQFLEAMEKCLPEFNFGSGFYLGTAPIPIEATDFALSKADFTTLKETFEASGADLIVWGEADSNPLTSRLCFATPDLLNSGQTLGFFTMDLEGQPKGWGEDEFRAMAYVAGRRLRPSLGKPSDFRAERFQPILESMSKLIACENLLTGKAKTELSDDFASGALHVGESLNSAEWLQKSAEFRATSLKAMSPGSDPIRWSQAKIDLGRAMSRLCELKFDAVQLQDAMTHIREGIDATKSDTRMQLAETGFAALQRAEQMLANRRRFSIRWSV